MKKINYFLFFVLMIFFADSSDAKIIATKKIQSEAGFVIFEFYDDPSLTVECRGITANGAIAKLQVGKKVIDYGIGCWAADMNGWINIHIKSFEDNVVRSSKIHSSEIFPSQRVTQDWSKKNYKDLHKNLSKLGLCNACADNVAQHIMKSKNSQCAKLGTH